MPADSNRIDIHTFRRFSAMENLSDKQLILLAAGHEDWRVKCLASLGGACANVRAEADGRPVALGADKDVLIIHV